MKNFRDLQVWHKAHELTLSLYRITRSFPKEELFGITSQLRRAAASVPANIAEGCGRGSNADFSRFLAVAMGSASEVQYFVLLSRDLRLIGDVHYDELDAQVSEVKRMLASLIGKIRADVAMAEVARD